MTTSSERPRRPPPLRAGHPTAQACAVGAPAPGNRSRLVRFRSRGDYGCACATHARRAGAPDGPLGDADHKVGSRREESPRALSGYALRRCAPHRVGRRGRSLARQF